MPKRASVFDLPPDDAAEARADAAAGADVKAGRVVPHERVREWLGLIVRAAGAGDAHPRRAGAGQGEI